MGLIAIKNIDLPMKVRLHTKKPKSRENKRALGRSIEERPVEVDDREEFGHWEIDTVVGKKSKDQALLTLTERKTCEG
jgi:transposase, IS30 family